MRAGIALGSNIEPRLEHLREAARRIAELSNDRASVLFSSIYETNPVDCPPDSPNFLNAAVEISTSLEPRELLARLQEIELDLGRPAVHGWNTPRTIDTDILYIDEISLDDDILTLPHPRVAERTFVLKPLSDFAPDRVLPGYSESISVLLGKAPKEDGLRLSSCVLYL